MRCLWSAILMAFVSTLAGADQPAVLALSDWHEQPKQDQPGVTDRDRTATFKLGPRTYALRYRARLTAGDPPTLDPIEGPIGLPGPASEGWYGGGFLFLRLNGQRVATVPLSSFTAAERGPRAVADLVWHHPLADVRYRFLGLGGDDKLLCRIDLEPKAELTSIELQLRAYPSYFTSWHKRVGARRVKTPGAVVEQGQHQTLPGDQAWWGVLYDEIFDPAKGEGKGPCAVAFDPAGLREVKVAPDSYPVTLTARFDPASTRLQMALWEFPGAPNQDVLDRFPQAADDAVAACGSIDWRPGLVNDFDYAGIKAEVQRAAKRQDLPKGLPPRLAEVIGWLDECAPLFETETAAITATERFLSGWEQYRDIVWELRLAELLNF